MQKRIVAFVARSHGLAGLNSLIQAQRYRPVLVCTHRRLPKVEDPERPERPDFKRFVELAQAQDIPLLSVDGKAEAQTLTGVLEALDFDCILSISWRRIIPPRHLEMARFGGVNLHRGRLPDYAGAEPIKQALAKGEREVVISGHVLVPEIDAGEVLATRSQPIPQDPWLEQDALIERMKALITPSFGPLTIKALDELIRRYPEGYPHDA